MYLTAYYLHYDNLKFAKIIYHLYTRIMNYPETLPAPVIEPKPIEKPEKPKYIPNPFDLPKPDP